MDETMFLELSVTLTGFEAFDLIVTGQLRTYRERAAHEIETTAMDAIVATWRAVRELPEQDRLDGLQALFDEEETAKALKRIIMLWYTGSWYEAPPYKFVTLSSQSYVQGLMWKAIGAHPMGAAPQGYGAWALPPPSEGA